MALQNLLGPSPVETFVSDSFSRYWANEIDTLALAPQRRHVCSFGEFPETSGIDPTHDIVLVLNGTNSGVCPPDLDWIFPDRAGLVIADAVSAAFTRRIDYDRVDVLCWSWQKALGGEGGHGMIALSPRAQTRLKVDGIKPVARLMKLHNADGSVNTAFFGGRTISTPSMFAVEDIHSALDWAEACGGLPALLNRVAENYAVMANWVDSTPWIDWTCVDPASRSACSITLRLPTEQVSVGEADDDGKIAVRMSRLLEAEGAAFDIWSYGDAPPGFRIWAGPTVESEDLSILCEWLAWAYGEACQGSIPPEARILRDGCCPSSEARLQPRTDLACLAPAAPQKARPQTLADCYDAILFDATGVLVSGNDALPGAADILIRLNKSRQPYYIVTNISSGSDETIFARLRDTGLPIPAVDRIVSAGGVARRRVLQELAAGRLLSYVGSSHAAHDIFGKHQNLRGADTAETFDTLVVLDDEGFDFKRAADRILSVFHRRLIETGKMPGMIAANADIIYPGKDGSLIFGPGIIGPMLEAGLAPFGAPPIPVDFVGKPGKAIFEECIARAGSGRLLMIGDQLDTDIKGAKAAGLDSLLLSSGLNGCGELRRGENDAPDYVAKDLCQIFDGSLSPHEQFEKLPRRRTRPS
ncbi:HAD hydrolase-like protein [Mesorhizobium sp. VK4C]|uniref:HAD hydrolase-like protein n=1 Tax=Mesorhizobium captivum TaxID=3072319 RepID=UPI002A24C224|nr:HAD hydrolase-like protein [Mesorhizobium sp. VK4C]MDX8503119.1 HAD hydrolase-like protein [Mesorhizobium sp. VK4C]